MDHATQVRVIKDIFRLLDTKTTDMADASHRNPVDVYLSLDRLAREQELLFRGTPQLVGFSSELPSPGDYVTRDEFGVPVVIVRSRSGTLNAFLNVCRHRGARVAEGAGHATALTCPFHGWSYDLGGQLVGQPCKEAFADVDKRSLALTRVPVVEKYGLIWLRPSVGPEFDLDQHLGGVETELATWGFEDFAHVDTRRMRHAMNWKLAVDTFGETYHFRTLHTETIFPAFFGNTSPFERFGRNHRFVLIQRSIEMLRDRPEETWDLRPHAIVVYYLYPNTIFYQAAGHFELFRMYPVGNRVDDSITIHSLYVPRSRLGPELDAHVQVYLGGEEVIADEDYGNAMKIHAGLGSGAQESIVFGRNEPALVHRHQVWNEALGIPASRAA